MEPYILSLLAGVLAGVIYSVIRVRSPAPPIIALVGLLGMVIGGQIIPVGHRLISTSDAGSPETGVLLVSFSHPTANPVSVRKNLSFDNPRHTVQVHRH